MPGLIGLPREGGIYGVWLGALAFALKNILCRLSYVMLLGLAGSLTLLLTLDYVRYERTARRFVPVVIVSALYLPLFLARPELVLFYGALAFSFLYLRHPPVWDDIWERDTGTTWVDSMGLRQLESGHLDDPHVFLALRRDGGVREGLCRLEDNFRPKNVFWSGNGFFIGVYVCGRLCGCRTALSNRSFRQALHGGFGSLFEDGSQALRVYRVL